jgi:hypothetical protein
MKRDMTKARAKVEYEGSCRIGRMDPSRSSECSGRIEAAHVIERRYDEEEDDKRVVPPDAVVALCTHHHQKYDARALDLLPFLNSAEQAEAVRRIGIERALIRTCPSVQITSAAPLVVMAPVTGVMDGRYFLDGKQVSKAEYENAKGAASATPPTSLTPERQIHTRESEASA